MHQAPSSSPYQVTAGPATASGANETGASRLLAEAAGLDPAPQTTIVERIHTRPAENITKP